MHSHRHEGAARGGQFEGTSKFESEEMREMNGRSVESHRSIPYDPSNARPTTAFDIPRVRPRPAPSQYNNYSATVKQKRFDTFGENAIERIYDEFRFLDESSPSPSCNSAQPILNTEGEKPKMRITTSLVAYCLLPLIQLLVSLALLAFGASRYSELFRRLQDRHISNLLLDLDKPEDFAGTNEEGASIVRIRTGTSLLIPSFLQCLAALFGFWPLVRKHGTAFQVLHIALSSISIVLWFGAMPNAAMELNLYHVQIDRLYENPDYFVFIVVLCLAYFEVLFLPTITIGIASFHLLPLEKRRRGIILSVSSSIATVLLAAAVICCSAYAVSRSMVNIEDWSASTLVNPGALYCFGLMECIVGGYVLVCSFIFFISHTLRTVGLAITGMVLQGICILSICFHVLSPDRLLSVSHNARVLSAEKKAYPVSQVNMILMYAFTMALAVSLIVQFILSAVRMGPLTKSPQPSGNTAGPSNVEQRTVF